MPNRGSSPLASAGRVDHRMAVAIASPDPDRQKFGKTNGRGICRRKSVVVPVLTAAGRLNFKNAIGAKHNVCRDVVAHDIGGQKGRRAIEIASSARLYFFEWMNLLLLAIEKFQERLGVLDTGRHWQLY